MPSTRTAAPRICFPARTQCLELTRQFCRETLRRHIADERLKRRIVLAIDEAVANIVEHAYGSCRDAETSVVELSLDVRPDRLEARLIDTGIPFDPRGVDLHPCLPGNGGPQARREAKEAGAAGEQRLPFPVRGFGLHLIRLIMDEIDYHRTAEGENVLVLTKHLRKGTTHEQFQAPC